LSFHVDTGCLLIGYFKKFAGVKTMMHQITKLGRGLSILILGKNIAKLSNLGSTIAGASSDYQENCRISKKISIEMPQLYKVKNR
jgi:hypothetical protein